RVFPQSLGIAIPPAILELHIAALGPAQSLQCWQKRRKARPRAGLVGNTRDHADAPHALLRPCRDRPRPRTAEQRDELAARDHSITSSAMASKEGGTVRPSILAVLALITSSNLLDCKTGKSAGFAPLRTRPV